MDLVKRGFLEKLFAHEVKKKIFNRKIFLCLRLKGDGVGSKYQIQDLWRSSSQMFDTQKDKKNDSSHSQSKNK